MAQEHAVVIGGSLAGMCAARVLREFFNKVTVIERDTYPERIDDRAGVPQGRGIHNLLVGGRREYERLFPGFERLMFERGAYEGEMGVNMALLMPIGWVPPRPSFMLPSLFGSRALIECTVRDLFRKLAGIEVLERTEVVALNAVRDGALRCTGVTVRPRDAGGNSVIDADLLVDASGRHSRSLDWLGALGLEPPSETVVEPFLGYASRWFRMRDGVQWPKDWWWDAGAWLLNNPLFGAVLNRYENGRWMLMFFGANRQYPPHEEAEFTAMAAKLDSPIIAEMLGLMEPVAPVHSHRGLTNRWRHYERWGPALGNFIAVGDASCMFNPIFAQGMTCAAVSASLLRQTLEECGPDHRALPQRFFAKQARFQRGPWSQAVSTDVALPGTVGDRSLALRLFNWYRLAVNLAAINPRVALRLIEVINLVRPTKALFAPRIMLRVAIVKSLAGVARLAGRSLIPKPSRMPPPIRQPAPPSAAASPQRA